MKKTRKLFLLLTTTAIMLTSCVVFASASTYTYSPFSFTTTKETSNCSFDARPANKIRFITAGSCPVSGAYVIYELHTDIWHSVQPDTQSYGMGPQRAWWYANPGKYHVKMTAKNNAYSSNNLANVTMTGTTWFENFEGNVG